MAKEIEGKVKLNNSNLRLLEEDTLYHLGYSTKDNLEEMFGDVKFVVMGGSNNRMKSFSSYLADSIGNGCSVLDLTKTDRFVLYKIDRTLSISHGMGIPSLSIMLHELIKLLHYSKCSNVILIRIGTSGGIDVKPGTLVISNKCYNGCLKEEQEFVILGKSVVRATKMDLQLAEEIYNCQDDSTYDTVLGGTMSTDDFYEGQARVDGAICDFSLEDKQCYLNQIKELGIYNIEMECTLLSALCSLSNLKCACVCTALLNRMDGDQVKLEPEVYIEYNMRPQRLIVKFIKNKLGIDNNNTTTTTTTNNNNNNDGDDDDGDDDDDDDDEKE